jgi:hypothetical protein
VKDEIRDAGEVLVIGEKFQRGGAKFQRGGKGLPG